MELPRTALNIRRPSLVNLSLTDYVELFPQKSSAGEGVVGPDTKFRGCAAALAACALIASGNSLRAATATTTMTVQMTITATCTVNSASTLNFGTQGVLAANVDQ